MKKNVRAINLDSEIFTEACILKNLQRESGYCDKLVRSNLSYKHQDQHNTTNESSKAVSNSPPLHLLDTLDHWRHWDEPWENGKQAPPVTSWVPVSLLDAIRQEGLLMGRDESVALVSIHWQPFEALAMTMAKERLCLCLCCSLRWDGGWEW